MQEPKSLHHLGGDHRIATDQRAQSCCALCFSGTDRNYASMLLERIPVGQVDDDRKTPNATHGPDVWDQNPWVAIYTLDVVEANVDAVENEQAGAKVWNETPARKLPVQSAC